MYYLLESFLSCLSKFYYFKNQIFALALKYIHKNFIIVIIPSDSYRCDYIMYLSFVGDMMLLHWAFESD